MDPIDNLRSSLKRAFEAYAPDDDASRRIEAALRDPVNRRRRRWRAVARSLTINSVAGLAIFALFSAALGFAIVLKLQGKPPPSGGQPAAQATALPTLPASSPSPSLSPPPSASPTVIVSASPSGSTSGFYTKRFVLTLRGPVSSGDDFAIYFPEATSSPSAFDFCSPLNAQTQCVSGRTYTRSFTQSFSTTPQPYRFERAANGQIQVIAQGQTSFTSDSTIAATYP